jgi:hypothetical protein
VIILPPADSLRASPLLTEGFFARRGKAFSEEEVMRIRSRLADVAPLTGAGQPAFTQFGLFRYNRVEALSGGVRIGLPVSTRAAARVEARLGVADLVPNVEASLTGQAAVGELELAAYYRLQAVSDWESPLGLDNSVNALLFASDAGEYYRAAGVSLELDETSGPLRHDWRLFGERHWRVDKNTDVSLVNLFGNAPQPANISADEINLLGLAGRVRVESGYDPQGLLVTATAWGEGAVGHKRYARLAAAATLSHPLGGRFAAALGVSAGTTWADVPAQRLYYLGGPGTLRGFAVGALAGETHWLAHAEVAMGRPAVRLVVFGDAGWAGDRSDFGLSGAALSVGAGGSALDGLLRLDVARGVRGPAPLEWKAYVYVDGRL